jgi:hypothetical protein
MIGTLKETPTGIIARSGFKYLRFNPGMSLLSEREIIVYKDEGYEYSDKTIYVSYKNEDILKESMIALVLKDCKILNCLSLTGKCNTNTGERTLVLTQDFELAPIISRNYRGQVSDRCDTQIYSDRDYIRYNVKWNKQGMSKTITTSLVDYNEDELWQTLYSLYPDSEQFLSKQKRSASNTNYEFYDRKTLNKFHLDRFRAKYGTDFRMNYDEDLSKFKSMDVIDLANIQEIKIDNDDNFDNYSIYEILPNCVKYKGTGFNNSVIDKLDDRKIKYYCMLVDNAIEHRIRKSTYATLTINTKVRVPETMHDTYDMRPSLLFLKFNRAGLKKWLSNNIISKL